MDYTESKEAADENMAAPHSNKSVAHWDKSQSSSDTDSQPWPSAIERQMAAASIRNRESHAAAEHPRDRRKKNDRRKTHRFGLGGFLVLLWLAAIGLILLFTDIGRTLQKVVSVVPAAEKSKLHEASAATADTAATTDTAANATATINATTSATAITDAKETLSIPIADVSLRDRPELFEQLAKVYRAQLASNPEDGATRVAFDKLQERSLSDIQTLIAQGDIANADKSLDIVARAFPELSDNIRYKYLLARTEYMHRQVKDESITQSEPTTSNTKAMPAAMPANASTSSAPAAKETPAAKKTSEIGALSKPEIRSVSIMPGTMVGDRFVPSDGGNVFMVELSYSNFAKAFIEQNEATLVTLLGEPNDSMVLAEVPITLTADRGTKSFVIETNNVQGYSGGKFQLNFILNGEFLTSRNVRLSKPRI